jgi:hypothetical protein
MNGAPGNYNSKGKSRSLRDDNSEIGFGMTTQNWVGIPRGSVV